MGISLRPAHLGRYREIGTLLLRYGRSDLVREAGLDAALATEDLPVEQRSDAARLTDDLERLGPTFVKMGQMLASRSDLLPPAYIQALSRLQDNVEPFPFEEVAAVVTEELGVRLSRAFDTFEESPLAAASLGQVHRATLHGGRPVVVKVQRPGVRTRVALDLDVLDELIGFLDEHSDSVHRLAPMDVLKQFRRALLDELDYRLEAANLRRLRKIVADRPLLVVPESFDDYTSSKVLTMQDMRGRKVTDVGPLGPLENDLAPLASELVAAYLDQILVEGFFHSDPHPGNILLTSDGRLALIDLGQVARLGAHTRAQLAQVLLALSEGGPEDMAQAVLRISTRTPSFNEGEFVGAVVDLMDRALGAEDQHIEAGKLLLDMNRICAEMGLRPAPEMALVGKALLSLDQVARALDPRFRPIDVVREHVSDVVQTHLKANPASLLSAAMEAKEFAAEFPLRANKVMDALSEGRFEVKVNAFDEGELLQGLHRVANRVSTGMVLAALIVGAALLARVPSSSNIAGYPSLAFVVFVLAALGGVTLLLTILNADRRVKRRHRRER